MNIDEFVSMLGDALGEPPRWDNDSVTLFIDDTEIIIEHVAANDYLYLYSPLAQISESGLERLTPDILSANLFSAETGGAAAMAYDASGERMVLWQKLRLSALTPDQFREEFMVFQGAARYWRLWFRDGGDIEPDEPDGDPFTMSPQLA